MNKNREVELFLGRLKTTVWMRKKVFRSGKSTGTESKVWTVGWTEGSLELRKTDRPVSLAGATTVWKNLVRELELKGWRHKGDDDQ